MSNEYMVTVSCKVHLNGLVPDYTLVEFPRSWVVDGFESTTNNSYFYGPKHEFENAIISIVDLFDRYKKNGYIIEYFITTEKMLPYRMRRGKL